MGALSGHPAIYSDGGRPASGAADGYLICPTATAAAMATAVSTRRHAAAYARTRPLHSFDPDRAARCEAGVLFSEILDLVVPRGWFLPVTPGTKFVTVGGAIANDVHGKNHHRAGTFGRQSGLRIAAFGWQSARLHP